ncbi:MAG: hypothetical protein V3T83_03510 [Acidobacteriota bacterium]
MPKAELQELDRLIRQLKQLAEQAHQASRSIPAAERNLYMILRHLEMLEIEICDPLSVLAGKGDETSRQDAPSTHREPRHAAKAK